jgi:hypothetical protein
MDRFVANSVQGLLARLTHTGVFNGIPVVTQGVSSVVAVSMHDAFTDVQATGVGRALQQNKDVTDLRLLHTCVMDPAVYMQIGNGVGNNSTILQLYVSSVEKWGFRFFVKGFTGNSHLKELTLSSCSIDAEA